MHQRLLFNRSLLRASIDDQNLHYGDPPNMWCCPSGPAMNSDMLRVIEYWRREKFDWVREPQLEIVFDLD